jgi:dCTP deaminase
MLLSYIEICELIEQGVIQNADFKDVNSASLDIHLGKTLMAESLPLAPIRLADRTPLTMEIRSFPYMLNPGDFVLAHSLEIFNLPNNISAEYKLKSSMARIGLEHLNAGWCDAGWNGSVLTLELKNMTKYHNIIIQGGDAIGQLVFFKHTPVPENKSYAARGRYNGDTSVQGIKK